MWSFIITIFGLCLFEVISSVDNAIVNAHILKTLPAKYRRIFLVWGLILAVFVIRGVLPFLIVWMTNSALSFGEIMQLIVHQDPSIEQYVQASKPLLLLGGGVYLFLVFLGWLFLEEKKYAFFVEHFLHRQSVWFYAIASLFLTIVIYYSSTVNAFLALSASIGSTAFFVTDGFKKNAEAKEQELMSSHISAWSKIMYLEILDASFSIDGVIGAFAFTISVPIILLGNGIGAWVVRELTIHGADVVSKYAYLKNGAMYSIGVLGFVMILESFGHEFPFWLAPLNTLLLLAIFLFLSYRELRIVEQK